MDNRRIGQARAWHPLVVNNWRNETTLQSSLSNCTILPCSCSYSIDWLSNVHPKFASPLAHWYASLKMCSILSSIFHLIRARVHHVKPVLNLPLQPHHIINNWLILNNNNNYYYFLITIRTCLVVRIREIK